MSPAVAGTAGAAIIVAFIPVLRRQLGDGALQIGQFGIRPILLRRSDHPVAFRIGAVAAIAITAALLATCALLIVRGIST